jgi:WD40 repeat protein
VPLSRLLSGLTNYPSQVLHYPLMVITSFLGAGTRVSKFAKLDQTDAADPSKLHVDAKGCWDLTFSPDGRFIVYASNDGIIEVRDVTTGEARKSFTANDPGTVRFSPDGTLLAAKISKGVVVWNFASEDVVTTLSGGDKLMYSVAFSPGGDYIASGSIDGTVWI